MLAACLPAGAGNSCTAMPVLPLCASHWQPHRELLNPLFQTSDPPPCVPVCYGRTYTATKPLPTNIPCSAPPATPPTAGLSDWVCYGRTYIANPDLLSLSTNIPCTAPPPPHPLQATVTWCAMGGRTSPTPTCLAASSWAPPSTSTTAPPSTHRAQRVSGRIGLLVFVLCPWAWAPAMGCPSSGRPPACVPFLPAYFLLSSSCPSFLSPRLHRLPDPGGERGGQGVPGLCRQLSAPSRCCWRQPVPHLR